MAGAEESRIGKEQCGWKQAVFQQFLGAVDVGQKQVQQAGALDQAGLHLTPFLGGNEERQQVQRPGAAQTFGVRINIIGCTVLAQEAAGAFAASREFAGA